MLGSHSNIVAGANIASRCAATGGFQAHFGARDMGGFQVGVQLLSVPAKSAHATNCHGPSAQKTV